MRNLAHIGLSALMLVVVVDFSSVWICVHPQACGDRHHEEAVTHVHAHDHGPFGPSRGEGHGRVEHGAELLGVCNSSRDAVVVTPPLQRIVPAFELAPFVPRADSTAAAGQGSLCPSPELRASGRHVLLLTERWLA